jgi:amino acid transporter
MARAGGNNTGNVFTLHFATIKGHHGFSGIAAGSIFTILAFIGFEASAPLAEEARNPRRTIQVAVVASCLFIDVFSATFT